MISKKKNAIAIIPARGGSKRIPRKNINDFLGKPIIAYSIEAAIQSNLFDTIMVSTDDEEIAEIAKKHGAEVPFMRSNTNADDYATTSDVLLEVIDKYFQKEIIYNYCCCIYPTAPLITSKTLIKAHNNLIENNFDSVFPVVKYSYPVQRGLRIVNNKANMVWPENLNERSQDLEIIYHDAGQFYCFVVDNFIQNKVLFGDNSGVIELSENEVQDIDNEIDWKLAEMKYKI